MRIHLDTVAQGWADRARKFADEELIPHEVEAELHDGKLPAEVKARHKARAVELGLSAMDVPAAHGGRDARVVDQVAAWEQLGRVTNALCWCFSEPHRWMFEACTPEQLTRFVLPLMTASARSATPSPRANRDRTSRSRPRAPRVDGGYAISGEKWYVTSANHADYFILQARLADGPHAGTHSLFFIDQGTPGIELVRTPAFSHTFSDHHPMYRFHDVLVPGRSGSGPKATA